MEDNKANDKNTQEDMSLSNVEPIHRECSFLLMEQ